MTKRENVVFRQEQGDQMYGQEKRIFYISVSSRV